MDYIRTTLRVILFYFLVILGVTVICIWDADAADTTRLVKLIRSEAVHHGIDPNLAVAIAQTESGLDPSVIGSQGEVGIFQIKPQFHSVDVRDTRVNISVAMKYLLEVKSKCEPKYKEAWIICYNLGPYYPKTIRYPQLFPYYVRVMKLKSKMIAAY